MPENKDEAQEPSIQELQEKIASDAETQTETLAQLSSLTDELESFKVKHAAAEKHKKEQEKAAKAALHEATKKSGDVEALELSWNEKYSTDTAQLKNELLERDKLLNQSTVGNAALLLATELALTSDDVEVLARYISDDLVMEIIDGKAVVKVTQNGKPSALTLNDLKEKIANRPGFAKMIKGSMADGGGMPGQTGGHNGSNKMKRSDWELLSQFERSKFITTEGNVLMD